MDILGLSATPWGGTWLKKLLGGNTASPSMGCIWSMVDFIKIVCGYSVPTLKQCNVNAGGT